MTNFKSITLKYILTAIMMSGLMSCNSQILQRVMDQIEKTSVLSNEDMGKGLKEALNKGISKGVEELSKEDGYYKSIYKILLPDEAMKVINKLKHVPGFSNVETIMLEKVNRAAEDAAIRAKPIFVNAITNMSFSDVKNILMGADNAATSYLSNSTRNQLYEEFNPVIVTSLNKFGALDYWASAVKAYNKIPFIKKMNPKLDDFVTQKSLDGLFAKVEIEEKNIRTNITSRTSDLLKRVFAKQD